MRGKKAKREEERIKGRKGWRMKRREEGWERRGREGRGEERGKREGGELTGSCTYAVAMTVFPSSHSCALFLNPVYS